MVKQSLTITNKLGLHARAAAKFVTLASTFDSDIQLSRGSRTVNGKSIMGVMMLAASRGTELELTASGDDASQAVEEILQLVNGRFGEDE